MYRQSERIQKIIITRKTPPSFVEAENLKFWDWVSAHRDTMCHIELWLVDRTGEGNLIPTSALSLLGFVHLIPGYERLNAPE